MQDHRVETRNNIVERLSRAQLSSQEDTVRKSILKAFADAGKAPSVQELAHDLGLPFTSVLKTCHNSVTVDIDGGLLQRAHPSTLVVWLSTRDGCCHAEVRCPLMNFFCDESHRHAWHATSPQESGTSLSILEALEVGKAAFGALLT